MNKLCDYCKIVPTGYESKWEIQIVTKGEGVKHEKLGLCLSCLIKLVNDGKVISDDFEIIMHSM